MRHQASNAVAIPANCKLISVVVAGAIGVLGMQAQAVAQQARVQFNIPAQPLGSALSTFASQSKQQVLFSEDTVRGRNAPEVSGSLTPQVALDRLLAGSGITVTTTGNGVYTLKPATANDIAVLPAVRVIGSADSVAERVNPSTTVGSKIPLTQREIPQSISVVTQDQIKQQNLATLNDAMRYTPGIFVGQNDSDRTSFYSRGYSMNSVLLDGIPTSLNLASSAPTLGMYERVEVLRGPAGLLNGFGQAGGTVNLVRKRAPKEFAASVELGGGTYGNRLGEIDVGGPLNEASTLKGRLVADYQDQDLTADGTWRRDRLIYGTLEADLTPSTTLRIGGSYNSTTQKDMWTGVPTFVNGSSYSVLDAPRSHYFGADWSRNEYDAATIFGELEHKFSQGWTSKLSVNYLQNTSHVRAGYFSGTASPTPNGIYGLARNVKWDFTDDQIGIDLYAAGPFQLFGRTHQLTIGADYTREKLHQVNSYITGSNGPFDLFAATQANLFGPYPYPSGVFDGPTQDVNTTTEQYGIYGNARFSLMDPLTLVVGGRLTWWDQDSEPNANHNVLGYATTHDQIASKATPYVGLIYDINKNYSVYASYTKIFNPQSSRDVSGNLIPPLTGTQYEVGVKGSYFNDKLDAAVALFDLTQSNQATSDLENPGYYVAAGKSRGRGIDVQINGELRPGWTILAGYTYTNTKMLDDSSPGTSFTTIAPRHLFKLWTNYQLSGSLNKWSIGAGTYISSEIYDRNTKGQITQGGFATVDARIGYQVNKHLSLALNASNLFDRHYYKRVGLSGGNFWGDPRKVMLTLRASY